MPVIREFRRVVLGGKKDTAAKKAGKAVVTRKAVTKKAVAQLAGETSRKKPRKAAGSARPSAAKKRSR